jgi:hypothetical protein
MDLLAAGLAMVLLHRADGGEVVIVPAHVASIHAKTPIDGKNKLVTHEARCVLWMDDGKLIAVLETCDVIKKLIGEATTR